MPAAPAPSAPARSRAAALPPEERRAAIVAAALPLFLEQGAAVTTREIAQAAGIAEGTIFRVFADKTELLDAVIDAALDPAPVEAALAAIDPTPPFEERLVAAADILRAARALRVPRHQRGVGHRRRPAPGDPTADRAARAHRDLRTRIAIGSAARPSEAARLLRGLTFACVHPSFGRRRAAHAPRRSSSVLLDGIRRTNRGERAVLIRAHPRLPVQVPQVR